MSDANSLVDSKVSASGEAQSLAIEKFNGQVKRAYSNDPQLMSYFDLNEVQGTNVISNKYLGVTQVQALAPGKDVRGSEVEFDKNSLVIDTTIISRNIVGVLDDVQDDIQTKGKLAEEQVTALKHLENRMLLQQGVYGAITNTEAKRTKPRVKGHGFSVVHTMATASATSQPLKLMAGIEWCLEDMMIQDVDLSKLTVFMPWIEFNALRDAERIVDARYNTASGDTVTGFVLKSYNVPIVPTNHFPNKKRDHTDIDGNDQDHHILSNANNSYRYDVTDEQEKCAALILGREGLLVGRSISLNGEIWFNKGNKSWYIDTYMSEGAIPDRWEHLAALVKGEADETGLDARYKRKFMNVTSSAAPVSPQAAAQDPAAFAAAVSIALEALVKPTALK
ncbi:major head protein [Vibrio phage D529]